MEKQTRKTSVWKICIWTGLWSKSYVYGTRRVTWSSQALPEDMKVVEVCRSLPGRLCQKDQECTALLRSSLSRHSCQTPAISHTCQTPWIILNTFGVSFILDLADFLFQSQLRKGFQLASCVRWQWPRLSWCWLLSVSNCVTGQLNSMSTLHCWHGLQFKLTYLHMKL